jgi:hypothetical protein
VVVILWSSKVCAVGFKMNVEGDIESQWSILHWGYRFAILSFYNNVEFARSRRWVQIPPSRNLQLKIIMNFYTIKTVLIILSFSCSILKSYI